MVAPASPARIARLGRRVGLVIFGIIVAGITAIWSIQIILQVWPPASGAAPACRASVLGLLEAVRRARAAAAQEPNGERAALERFRSTLRPQWNERRAVRAACQGDAEAVRALRQVDALRYAEEHAVRYEAVSLAEQRRQTDAIARELLGTPRR